MELVTRTLVQERAILVARQGDPKSPAAGTLLARQRILHAELEAAHDRTSTDRAPPSPPSEEGVPLRHADQIRRDIRRIERDLGSLQSRLRDIDQEMEAAEEEKRRS